VWVKVRRGLPRPTDLRRRDDAAATMQDRQLQQRQRALEQLKHYRRIVSTTGTGIVSGMAKTSSESCGCPPSQRGGRLCIILGWELPA
jgi:hypothetical protein